MSDEHKFELRELLDDLGVGYAKIGYPTPGSRTLHIKKDYYEHTFDIDHLRDVWYKTSYMLDRKQSKNGRALMRFEMSLVRELRSCKLHGTEKKKKKTHF